MNENEFLLQDRLGVIRDTINKYGEDNFYLSFSGGKDSTILHYLLDMALPNNKIPRVFINTGIEFIEMVKFVQRERERDERIEIVKPTKNIKATLEEYGYPFKSKRHSEYVRRFQSGHIDKPTRKYFEIEEGWGKTLTCPKLLKYQATDKFKLKVSALCCDKLKKEPSKKWANENNKSITITGMRQEEGGNRTKLECFTHNHTKFHPLVKVNDEWEEWFIKEYNIKLCELYYPPYNFTRTGCKGCPYSLNLEEDLATMGKLLPNEKAQCETIWQPVYEEYRRIGYRLKKEEQTKLF